MNESKYNKLNNLLKTARDFYNQGEFSSSKDAFEACLQLSEEEPLLLFEYGCCLFHLRNYDNCLTILHKLITIDPKHARGHSLIATIYSDIGNKKEACKHHYKAIQLDPTLTQSAYGYAKSASIAVTDEPYSYIQSLLDNHKLNINDKMRIYFSLSEIHYSNNDYEGQIKFLKLGNGLGLKSFPFNAEQQFNNTNQIISSFSTFKKPTYKSTTKYKNIFILGLPRCGSTLLEQMLASHSAVKGFGETDILSRSLGFMSQQLNHNMNLLEQLNEVSETVLDQVTEYFESQFAIENYSVIVEKQLFNYTLVGLAKLMKPDSVFIDLRRNPASQFISCYSILFGENRGFTHSVDHFIDAYQNQRQLMDFWKKLYPKNIVTVYYEDLVNDPERSLSKILAKVDCKFEPACLEYYLSNRVVTSASQLQIRQPISNKSVDRWDNYQNFMLNESDKLKSLVEKYLMDKENEK